MSNKKMRRGVGIALFTALSAFFINGIASAQETKPIKATRQGPGIIQNNIEHEEIIIENYATKFALHSASNLNPNDDVVKSLSQDTSYDNNFKKSMIYYMTNLPDSTIKYSQVKEDFSPLKKMISYCIQGRGYEKKGDLKKAIKCYEKAEQENTKGNSKKIVGPYDNPFSPGYFLGIAHINNGGNKNIEKGILILEKEYADAKNNLRSDDCALLRLTDEIAKAHSQLDDLDKMFKWMDEGIQYGGSNF